MSRPESMAFPRVKFYIFIPLGIKQKLILRNCWLKAPNDKYSTLLNDSIFKETIQGKSLKFKSTAFPSSDGWTNKKKPRTKFRIVIIECVYRFKHVRICKCYALWMSANRMRFQNMQVLFRYSLIVDILSRHKTEMYSK